jgi:hypothetical protein
MLLAKVGNSWNTYSPMCRKIPHFNPEPSFFTFGKVLYLRHLLIN